MADDSQTSKVASAMRQINRAWLDGQLEDLEGMVHPEIVMVFPGFEGRSQGRGEFIAGFEDFLDTCTVHQFREHDYQVDVFDDAAVVSFAYDMDYEREERRFRATGRDLWVFRKRDGDWVAVWRTMLEVEEKPIDGIL